MAEQIFFLVTVYMIGFTKTNAVTKEKFEFEQSEPLSFMLGINFLSVIPVKLPFDREA